MDQSDIKEIVKLLEHALLSECWDSVEESVLYMKEFIEDGKNDSFIED
jgi:hypothetical protein